MIKFSSKNAIESIKIKNKYTRFLKKFYTQFYFCQSLGEFRFFFAIHSVLIQIIFVLFRK